jgi:hypothetical protein
VHPAASFTTAAKSADSPQRDITQWVLVHWLAFEATKYSPREFTAKRQEELYGKDMSTERQEQLAKTVQYLTPLFALAPPSAWSPQLLK